MNKPNQWGRVKPGSFVAIPLPLGGYGFGRTLFSCVMAYYDIRSDTVLSIEEIERAPVLWKLAGASSAVRQKRWQVIGHKPLQPGLLEPVKTFRPQNPIDANMPYEGFRIYVEYPEYGKFDDRPASPEECVGLELTSVYDPEHVEERLANHFSGKPDLELQRHIDHLRKYLKVQ